MRNANICASQLVDGQHENKKALERTDRRDDELEPASESCAVKLAVHEKGVIAEPPIAFVVVLGTGPRALAGDELDDRGRDDHHEHHDGHRYHQPARSQQSDAPPAQVGGICLADLLRAGAELLQLAALCHSVPQRLQRQEQAEEGHGLAGVLHLAEAVGRVAVRRPRGHAAEEGDVAELLPKECEVDEHHEQVELEPHVQQRPLRADRAADSLELPRHDALRDVQLLLGELVVGVAARWVDHDVEDLHPRPAPVLLTYTTGSVWLFGRWRLTA